MSERDLLSLMLEEMRSMNQKIDILMADKNFRDGQEETKRRTQKYYVAAITFFVSTVVTLVVDLVKRKILS